MESSTHSKPPKNKAYSWGTLIIIWVMIRITLASQPEKSPHTVFKLTWQVLSQTGDIIWEKTENHPLYTWWPTLTPDFCSLAAGLDTWDIPGTNPKEGVGEDALARSRRALQNSREIAPGCSSQAAKDGLSGQDFYVCPRDGRTWEKVKQCGSLDYYYCATWGCETTGDAYWKPSSTWDKIKVTRG